MRKFTCVLLSLLMIISMTMAAATSVSAVEAEETAVSLQESADMFSDELKTEEMKDNGKAANAQLPDKDTNTALSGADNSQASSSAAEVTGLEIIQLPDEYHFIAGKEYFLTNYLDGMIVKVSYSDSTSKIYEYDDLENGGSYFFYNELRYSCSQFGGYADIITPHMGENVIYISLGNAKSQFIITAYNEIESIEITQQPEEYEFISGQSYYILDYLSGMEITATFSDGTSKVYAYDDYENGGNDFFCNELLFYDEDMNYTRLTPKSGDNVIYVSCGNATDSFTIKTMKVKSIEIIKQPDDYQYIAGNEYFIINYLEGMEIKVTDNDGKSKVYAYNDYENGGNDFYYSGVVVTDKNGASNWITPQSGKNVLTVSYGGATAEFTITALQVKSIEVTQMPDKTEFIAGNKYSFYDFEGMEIKANFSNGTSQLLSSVNDDYAFFSRVEFSGDAVVEYEDMFIPTPGQNTFTVAFGGATAEFTVTGLEVQSIEILKQPDDFEFVSGEEYCIIDYLSSMVVKVNFENGTTKTYSYSDYKNGGYDFFCEELKFYDNDMNYSWITFQAGDNVINISCGNASTSFTINVASVTSLKITQLPDEYRFIAGKEYDIKHYLNGMEINVTLSDGTDKTYAYDDYVNGGFEFFDNLLKFYDEDMSLNWVTLHSGENVITITYGDASTTFKVNAYNVSNLEITKQPDAYKYTVGKEYFIFDCIQGMEIKVTFDDGKSIVYAYDDYDNGGNDFFGSELYFYDENDTCHWITPHSGENVITVFCGGAKAEFTINAVEVTNIEITQLPDHHDFIAGNAYYIFNYLDGMEVKVTFADSTSKVYAYDDYENGGNSFFNKEIQLHNEEGDSSLLVFQPGENVITMSYGGETADFTIEATEVLSLEITQLPERTQFFEGNEYYLASYLDGMEVKVTFADSTSRVYAYDDYENGGNDFFYYDLQFRDKDLNYGWITPNSGENVITVLCGYATAEFSITGIPSIDVREIGDVNCDGEVNIKDAAAIQLQLARLNDGSFDQSVADVNRDGEFNIKDAAYLQLDLARLL